MYENQKIWLNDMYMHFVEYSLKFIIICLKKCKNVKKFAMIKILIECTLTYIENTIPLNFCTNINFL